MFVVLFGVRVAFVGAIPLVLGESYIVIMFLTRTYLIGQASTDLFDAVCPYPPYPSNPLVHSY